MNDDKDPSTNQSYYDQVKAIAESIGSDGCTRPALQIHVVCCWEHDIAYVTGKTPRGVPISRAGADQRFRDCNRAHSPLKWLSPLAMLRYFAVSRFGGRHYRYKGGDVVASLTGQALINAAAAIGDARDARVRILLEMSRS